MKKLEVKRKKLYEEVMEKIVELIDTEEYRVGDRLPSVMELSNMLKVGKPSIREALSVLTTIGVLEIKHGSGIFITRFPQKFNFEYKNIFSEVENEQILHWLEFRKTVEAEAVELASLRATSTDIENIEKVFYEYQENIKKGKSNLGYEFHYAIAVATHNPIFIQVLSSSPPFFEKYLELNTRQSLAIPPKGDFVLKEHYDILQAIKNHQPKLARKAMLKHITTIEKKVKILG